MKAKFAYRSRSEKETMEFAKRLAEEVSPGDVICLVGELGSGKTVFAKGFAAGLGIACDITSPTFVLINEYPAEAPGQKTALYHFDAYRLEYESAAEALFEAGAEGYFYGDGVGPGVCLIEWADLVKPIIPDNARWFTITVDERGDRVITEARQ